MLLTKRDQPKPTLTLLQGAKALDADALFAMFEKMTGRTVTDEERHGCFAILAKRS
jgi:hypothetical protein